MKLAQSLLPSLMALGAFVSSANAALVVVPSDNSATLLNSILGSGISVVGGSVAYSQNGGGGASGTFTGGVSAGIGIGSGLIMTTGFASSAPGPNTVGNTSGPGNFTSLSFDFTTAGGDLFFNYVFASEEYNEYVHQGFNDHFEFLLDGNNIALIPSTSTPVSIDTVNLGDNSAFYNNNSPGPFNLQYDGFTDVFTASALGLSAGQHSIQLRIADSGDSDWDSAVFIQANSFSDQETSVPEGGNVLWVAIAGMALASSKMRKSRRAVA